MLGCAKNMHQAIVNIILDQIKDQFISETVCVTYFLDVTKEEWEDWKKGYVHYQVRRCKN